MMTFTWYAPHTIELDFEDMVNKVAETLIQTYDDITDEKMDDICKRVIYEEVFDIDSTYGFWGPEQTQQITKMIKERIGGLQLDFFDLVPD